MKTQAPLRNDVPQKSIALDYSLTSANSLRAVKAGLAEADWYISPIRKDQLHALLQRKDGPALRDCAIYFGLILLSGYWAFTWRESLSCLLPFMIYGVLYASASDARWHESSHGTAFKTDWMNNLLYEIASFMVLRESIPWRWSHTRHHSDTIIVGRDPEIAVPRPPNLKAMLLKCINFQAFRRYVKNIALHCVGKVNGDESTFVPKSEYSKVFLRARIYAAIYIFIIGLCLYYRTALPFLFVLGPNLYGAWLMPIYGWTQHAGLAENVLDHRLNCRTIKMNFVHRFLYWNMNYHLEHHMFPLVPYHALPKLHELIKDDCPPPYRSLTEAYREIIPTVLRQIHDPGYFVKRPLPKTARPVGSKPTAAAITPVSQPDKDGWLEVGDENLLSPNEAIKLDYDGRTFAIYRTDDNKIYATDGICTHGNTHLADGLIKGKLIECPKHNGRFSLEDGTPKRAPACVALQTHPAKVQAGKIWIRPQERKAFMREYRFRVVSNQNVATFIKELVLEPASSKDLPDYQPGDYMQLKIPAYREIQFSEFDVPEPFTSVWRAHHVFDLKSSNPTECRRNYSIATRPGDPSNLLRFNIRIATPPRGLDAHAGVGSTYIHHLKPGDQVSAVGPFGEFHIQESDREMVYLGGGAGMAPLRSHLSHLFENLKTQRKVSFWYGARSKQEIFYEEYFRSLERNNPNFRFQLALSEPQPEDDWQGHRGYIHEILKREYLDQHSNAKSIEYYLCGPPQMLKAAIDMLTLDYGVERKMISSDEF